MASAFAMSLVKKTKEPSPCLPEIASDLLNPVAEWAITGTEPEYELEQIIEDGAVGVLTALMSKGGARAMKSVIGKREGIQRTRETLDTGASFGYDNHIQIKTGGMKDEQGGAHGEGQQISAELSGLADSGEDLFGRVDAGGVKDLAKVTSGRTGNTYRFRRISPDRLNERQNAILQLAEADGVKVFFAEDGKIEWFTKDQEIKRKSFSGVYLKDGQIILSHDGISYEHEIFHHYEAIHKDIASRFSEIVQQQIRMGDPKVMAYLHENVVNGNLTMENIQSEIAADVFSSLRRGVFEREWGGFFANPEAIRLAFEQFLAESGVRRTSIP